MNAENEDDGGCDYCIGKISEQCRTCGNEVSENGVYESSYLSEKTGTSPSGDSNPHANEFSPAGLESNGLAPVPTSPENHYDISIQDKPICQFGEEGLTGQPEVSPSLHQVSASYPPSPSNLSPQMEDTPPPLPSSPPPFKTLQFGCGSDEDPNFYQPDVGPGQKVVQDKMISGLGQFFDTDDQELSGSESEIAKILADFNEILNSEDPYAFTLPESEDLITNTVESFSELLIGGNGDNELLIVVDVDDQSGSYVEDPKPESSVTEIEGDEEYFEEGYESDLPMVRKSMRKMRPVQMGPFPIASSSTSSPGPSGVQAPFYPKYIPSTVRPLNNLNRPSSQPLTEDYGRTGDNHTVVLDLETDHTMSTSTTIEMSSPSTAENVRSPSNDSPSEGCATFRPTTDLVFSNLHALPPDLTEAFPEPDDAVAGNEAATNGNPRRRRRAHRSNTPATLRAARTHGRWPHRLSSVLALIGCTLGLTNICRFATLSVQYGANFTLQFAFLSLVFGIPLFLFHMSIGQYLSAGIIDMWKISPIFQGIGIGIVISQAMIGIYTAVGVSWMFIYFRDSFIPRYDQYRWGKCFRDYRACDQNPFNSSQLSETVPDYFNGVVLQRSSPEFPSSSETPSGLKFTVAFNLAVVWMLVFVSLSKGLKSYGKVIHGFILVPIMAMLVLSSKMVGLVPSEDAALLFGQTSWDDFFFNTHTWIIAAREAFFTWGLFGACVMQITAHNRSTHALKADATIIVLITSFILLLASFLGNACHYVLMTHGFEYVPSSFESENSFRFLIRKPMEGVSPPLPPYLAHQHTSFLMGVRVTKTEIGEMFGGSSLNTASGYQALRLATELFPAAMVLLGSQGLSPFWTVLFYFTFILFGLAQQLAIWYTVFKGVIAIKPKILRSWETTISFSICAVGFLLGLPLCTEFGIFVEYFLDYTIGSGWWIMVLYLLELVAVFIVRGAPYCGENVVTVLLSGENKLSAVFAPILSFIWNVILPVAILILSISSFKSGNVRELYDWAASGGYLFWPSWTRELGSLIQLLPLLTIPFVAIIQSCRYLSNGPPALLDRIQLLYRPHSRGISSGSSHPTRTPSNSPPGTSSQARSNEDPPPKYTPPPSYSAVTGAKIAKFLRNSLRRSLRRIAGPNTTTTDTLPPPPNYDSVILEINARREGGASGGNHSGSLGNSKTEKGLIPILITPPMEELAGGSGSGSSSSSGRRRFEINIIQNTPSLPSTLGRGNRGPNTCQALSKPLDGKCGAGVSEKTSLRRIASDITPREVARVLRASFRHGESPDSAGPFHIPVSASYSNPNTGSSEPTYTSLQHEMLDSLAIINQETVSSTGSSGSYVDESPSSIPWHQNFDFTSRSSRNRRSNDSQLGLLAHQQIQDQRSSQETLNCFGRMNVNLSIGMTNPTFGTTPSSSVVPVPVDTSSSHGGGHFRSQSLTVPIHSLNSVSSRHHYHRTN